MKILELVDVHTYYGESHILNGISLKIDKGSVVALLGRNGMGKTTTVYSIVGFVPLRQGMIYFNGKEITHLMPHQICQSGIALAPQGKRVFPSLSVRENLIIGARNTTKSGGWSLERVYSTFPLLERRANSKANLLSGGEQEMLCIARALLTNPELLLMDEPSEGLAPLIIKEIGHIISQLKDEGASILLVEQNLPMALRVSNCVYILCNGEIVYQSNPQELSNNRDIQAEYLAVGAV